MKFLVIGCGSAGQRHIRNLVSANAAKILAFDIDKQKLKKVKGISRSVITSDKLNILCKEKPQAAFITVPTALHIPYALQAAERDCHLFIEKPLSHNTNGLGRLLGIVKRKRLVTFVGYNYRFNRCLVKIKKLLKNKAIGKVIAGRTHFGSYLPERHPGEDYRSGYGAKKSLGGGVVLDVLSHHLDSLIFLFGRPKEAFGYSGKGSTLDIDVEDTAEALIKFPKGEVVSLHTNFIQRPYKHTLELIGEKGTIFCDFVKNIVKYYDVNRRKWITFYGDRDPNLVYLKEVKHFIKCIKKKAGPPVDVKGAKEELKLLMKVKKTAPVQRWIKI